MEREALCQRARFERYAADMLYAIAAGIRIDTDKTERFRAMVDKVYQDPFRKAKKKPETAAEITDYIYSRFDELRRNNDGSDEARRADNAG